ncbi:MAG: DUF4010 domain-containing protein [Steroidobacteraceae bacterium]
MTLPADGLPYAQIAVALGIGLMIGAERERRRADRGGAAIAGVRTFTICALLGAIGALLDSTLLLVTLAAGLIALTSIGYAKDDQTDRGLTTEVALLATFSLGALALHRPALAAGLGVIIALLLAARAAMHEFVANRLSDREVMDGLLLAASALVILPLLPDRSIDPWQVINPQLIGRLTVLILLLNAAGYLATRALGAGRGLAMAGFFGGFVSSSATIAAMAARAQSNPALRSYAVAGATLSSVATVIQMAMILAVADRQLLLRLTPALVAMGLVALAYAGILAWHAVRDEQTLRDLPGRAFQPRLAVLFALLLTGLTLLAAIATQQFGSAGALLSVALGGLADTHAAAASVGGLAASGAMALPTAALGVLLALTSNSLTKMILAISAGGSRYALVIVPGIVAMLIAAWLVAWLGGVLR